MRSLSELQRVGPEFLAELRSDHRTNSIEFARKIVEEAKDYGLNMRDYLTLKVDPRLADDPSRFTDGNELLSGYEAALSLLNLPVRDDFKNGVVLQAASDTFNTFPGVRALFPPVIDDVVQFKYRQDQLETPTAIVGNSRTISGVEMITTVIDDKAEDYQGMHAVSEMGRIRVKSIRATEQSVKIWKHGLGYRTSYEFERRARIEMLVPYVNRSNREIERSKTWKAVDVLINGDGVHDAADVVNQSSFNTAAGVASTNGKISYRHLLCWLVARAQAGVPVDTVVGNWDAYIQWLMLFAVPTGSNSRSDAEALAAAGFQMGGVPILKGTVNFALGSNMPASQLLGMTKGDTLEELVEAGSLISESERSIENQTISYYKTENSGYRLVFGDTREIFDFGA